MTILEKLEEKYGKEKVEKFLDKLNNCDKNFQLFKQHILLTECVNEDNYSFFKSYAIPLLNKQFGNDRYFLYDIVNTISSFDFTFKKYNTCITYGTFDLFHIGHLKLLKRIKSMCSNLIVAVSTDEFNKLKGKTCIIPYEQRSAIVAGIKYVDKVIPENNWEQKHTDIEKYNVDCFVMGNDWEGKFDFLKEKCEVIYLPRTDGISTTELKEKLKI
jgi:glycerol-3-phosphate cytidylyltransferase